MLDVDSIQKEQVDNKSMDIAISMPKHIPISLVQSNHLRDYEIFMWLASLFATAAAGFWVSFATIPFNKVLFGVSVIFTLFTVIFGVLAFFYRSKMSHNGIVKTISMQI